MTAFRYGAERAGRRRTSLGRRYGRRRPGAGALAPWVGRLLHLAACPGEPAPHYRVIRYDTRGFGNSPAPAAPFSQVDDLAAVLDNRDIDLAILAGHSGGGGTAIGLALADPARVRGLLLLVPGVPDYPRPPDDPYSRQSTSSTRPGIGRDRRTWPAHLGRLGRASSGPRGGRGLLPAR